MKNGTLLLQNCTCYWILLGFRSWDCRLISVNTVEGRHLCLAAGPMPAHILSPASIIKFLDMTSGEAFIREANV
jgi:hypothetical protein